MTHFLDVSMSEQRPKSLQAADHADRNRTTGTSLHPAGISVFAFAMFYIYVFTTRVPAGKFSLLGSSLLTAATWAALISLLPYCAGFVYACRLLKRRSELIYLSGPIAMYGYLIWRMVAG